MSKGWISIHREIQDHWLWKEKRIFSKLEAWLDILITVNHSEQKVMIKNTLFNVKRGDSIMCLDTWSNRWNWNKSKVRRFLKVLEKENMIELKNETKTTRITVCKYDSYQTKRNADETQMKRKRNADETQTTPNNNDNNINNINNENKEKAFAFLKSNPSQQLESFIMQNKSNVNDWQMMIDSYNDQIDLEIAQNKISFNVDELLPRLKKWCRNWINNQKHEPKQVSSSNYFINEQGIKILKGII